MKYKSIQHSKIISNLINLRFQKQSKKILEDKDEILEQSFEIEENNKMLIKEAENWRSKSEKYFFLSNILFRKIFERT